MSRVFAVLFILAAVAGLVFASLSTSDFVQHLDRQVHAIHCSFVPGMAATTDAASGCHVALMSSWSSVFRTWVWGGLPVALPGMAVFAFLVFRGLELWLARGLLDRNAALFLFTASLVPVFTSVFFAVIAVFELETFCRTCAGIYLSSLMCLAAAVGLVFTTWNALEDEPEADLDEEEPPEFEHPAVLWGVGIAEGVGFVLVVVLLYLLVVPDHSRFVGTCGELAAQDEPRKDVLVPIGRQGIGEPAIEVFDPLCPACRGFEQHLASSGLDDRLSRKALLFPLDTECNWMITQSLHPGACAVSRAVLCAEDDRQAVIDWAFAHQEEIKTAADADKGAASAMVVQAFPGLKRCVDSKGAVQRLNQSLRWAVSHQLPILTPQLYVGGKKLCDEDTDLGLDFALSRLIAQGGDR